MSMIGDRVLVSSTGCSRCLFSKEPQAGAGSRVQGQAEGHTRGIQKVTAQAGKKANNVVWEIRLMTRNLMSKEYRQGIGKKKCC